MKIGDIVQFEKNRWLVTGQRPGKLCLIRTWAGQEKEVPESADTNPASGLTLEAAAGLWPFMTVPLRAKDGPVVRLTFARDGRLRDLEPLVEWAPGSILRPGGPVFLNPQLNLRIGEVLGAVYTSGRQARLTVTAAFASVRLRQHRLAMQRQPVVLKTVYDRLMSDDFEDL